MRPHAAGAAFPDGPPFVVVAEAEVEWDAVVQFTLDRNIDAAELHADFKSSDRDEFLRQ